MADDQDPASKTEDATSKKLEEAHKKGNVARSIEINHWFLILGGAIVVGLFSKNIMGGLSRNLSRFVASPDLMPTDGPGLINLLSDLAVDVLILLAPIFGVLALLAAGGNLVQNRPGIAWEKIAPDFSKLSPMKGLKRLFSVRSLVDFAKSLLKVVIVTTVGIMVIRPEMSILPDLIATELEALPERILHLTIFLFVSVLAVMTVVAAADILYQKLSHLRQLKMTRQEVKDEHRQAEGDPAVKSRIRALRVERSRKRMMAAVPTADVVVTNPTHFAVALRYDTEKDAAPRVVAKGQDLIAATIRETAEAHRIPIVQNPPLARALYEVELDRQVSIEHYKAVAEVIGYVMRLKGKVRPRQRPGPGAPPASPPGAARPGGPAH